MIVNRIGDTVFGICFWPPPPAGIGPTPAVGIIVSGDPLALDSGLPIAGLGDTVIFPCGTAIIMGGTPMELNSGKPTSILGTTVIGPMVQAVTVVGDPLNISV